MARSVVRRIMFVVAAVGCAQLGGVRMTASDAPRGMTTPRLAALPSRGVVTPSIVQGPGGERAVTPTAAFDKQGRLWVVWIEGSHIQISSSNDRGRTFTTPVRVTRESEDIDANGEARPKIALGPGTEIYVSWTRRGAKPYTGDIRFASSRDGGRTFSTPVTINDDRLETGHRFDALSVSRGGHVYLAWIDKRDLEQATARGSEYAGAALYYTVSVDGGRTFQPNQKIKDHICECCRIAIDFDRNDLPVMVWRDVIDGTTRDHGIVRFTTPTTVAAAIRATTDGWKIDACPHHGPALSISDDGTFHMTWFTGEGPDGAGSFYARSSDGGMTFSSPIRVSAAGTNMHAGAHAVVLSHAARVVLAWKGVGPPTDRPVFVRESRDGGRSWGGTREVARAKEKSDHPFLLRHGSEFFLSWFSSVEGYRLVPLDLSRETEKSSAQ